MPCLVSINDNGSNPMQTHILAGAILSTFLLTGCSHPITKEDQGRVAGGIIGGALASQIGDGSGRIVAAAAGTLIGSFIGGSIGRSMDELDRLQTHRVLETVPTGATSEWHNPDTQVDYAVTPTKTYYEDSGTPCREYTINGHIGGKHEEIYGTACRQADGSWKIQS